MVAGLAAWITEAQKANAKKQIIPLVKKETVFFILSHPLWKILGSPFFYLIGE